MTRYLVVDDSRTSRMMLAAAIRNACGQGAEIDEAGDLDEALKAFGEKRPEVVFLDMMLDLTRTGTAGGSTGLVALDLILRERPDARVVLVTALPADHPDVVDAVSLGAFAHLEKPIRTDAVKRVLATLDAEQGRARRVK